ncbi:MAG: nucleotide sugar dehydrogenase [Candidatus Omnitrophica bacterium]|nr:nucleotide sugar dehydrogenase [Candidatus Omnitrophota bacterium]
MQTVKSLAGNALKLEEKIASRQARVGVIGMGYVGLPLAVSFAEVGFTVTGIDIDARRAREINAGRSYIGDVDSAHLKALVEAGVLSATSDTSVLGELDTVNICVPTPLRKTREPDISFIVAACQKIQEHLHAGQMVILESTTYPGTTEEVILPMLTGSNLKVGEDIFLAFSPERVDPGNRHYNTRTIPKVVGGITPVCTRLAAQLYQTTIHEVVPVSSPRSAEMVKLLENTFRSVNIGLVNELTLMSAKLGVNIWEVIDAAATKPFGFMPFYPGPGLGGHCIPIDPHYLSWKARAHGFNPRFIELASEVNRAMPDYCVERVTQILNDRKKSVNGSRLLVLGVAYKRDVNDWRESPALDILQKLLALGAEVAYHDPHVPEIQFEGITMKSNELTDDLLRETDCCIIVTDHSRFDIETIAHKTSDILDARNATKGLSGTHARITRI